MNDHLYSYADFDAMTDDELYELAKELRIHNAAFLGSGELKSHVRQSLTDSGRLSDGAGVQGKGGDSKLPVPMYVCATYAAYQKRIAGCVGKPVRQLFGELQAAWNIADNVKVFANGVEVNMDHVLTEDVQVEFIRPSGEKGN